MDKLRPVSLILFVPLLLLFTGCRKHEFYMPLSTMEPTIPKGSTVVTDLRAYRDSEPERFDIVVFHPPPPEPEERFWVFRIVGLPGEEIAITDDGVFIDSEILDPPDGLSYIPADFQSSLTLAAEEFFLLGDNTAHSHDSRFFGAVPRENIIGKVIGIQPGEGGNGEHHGAEERLR